MVPVGEATYLFTLPCSTRELRQFVWTPLIEQSEINVKKDKENETATSGDRVSCTQEIRLICKRHTESCGHDIGVRQGSAVAT